MWGEQNCPSFETAAGGLETQSSLLTVRHSNDAATAPHGTFQIFRTAFLSMIRSWFALGQGAITNLAPSLIYVFYLDSFAYSLPPPSTRNRES